MTARPTAEARSLYARLQASLPRLLPAFLPRQRWFGGKARAIAGVDLEDAAWLPAGAASWALTIVAVRHTDGSRGRYGMLLGLLEDPGGLPTLGRLDGGAGDEPVWIVEATGSPEAAAALLGGLVVACELPTVSGATLRYGDIATGSEGALRPEMPAADSVRLLGAEQSNTSVRIGRSHVFKLFRRLEEGENPEVEITRFLTGRTSFRAVPGLRGSLTYAPTAGPATTLGVLQDWLDNDGDGWSYTVAALREIFRGGVSADALVADMRRLGEVTGEFHAALASDPAAQDFAPEPATPRDLEDWQSSLAARAEHLCRLLADRLTSLPASLRPLVESLLGRRGRFEELVPTPDLDARRGFAKIRVHGDFHLGQTLKTAAGFVLFDFEGEPARPLTERRAKHCALKDVAGMLRSFDYAIATARGVGPDRLGPLAGMPESAAALADLPAGTDPRAGTSLLREAFLEGYRGCARGAVFLPSDDGALAAWLDFFELDKALYEVEYEVNNRPDWVAIPLEGMRRIMERREA